MNRAFCSLTCVVALSASAGAGQLAPPVGPVGPTMKDLDTVEPRTPVGPETTPGDATSTYIINAPGSYYLTENLVGTVSDAGIVILAPDVTLDLNGFVVQGPGVTGNFEPGILGSTAAINLVFRNGAVADWEGDGVFLDPSLFSSRSSVEDLTVRDCGESGIETKRSAYVTRCFVENCGATGIRLSFGGSIVTDCISNGNVNNGYFAVADTVFERCLAAGNQREGFRAQGKVVFRACVASDNIENGFEGFEHCRTVDCASINNGLAGFDFVGAFPGPHISSGCIASENTGAGFIVSSDAVLSGCSTYFNGGPGFDVGTGSAITNCAAGNNSGGGFLVADRCQLSGCVARSNTGNGIAAGRGCVISQCVAGANSAGGITTGIQSRIVDCTAQSNTLDGILCGDDSSVSGCVAGSNGDDGIDAALASAVRSCSAISNGDDGIVVGQRGQILACVARVNGDDGLEVGTGGGVYDSVSSNNLIGIRLDDRGLASRCTTWSNTNFGIWGDAYNRIHECICSDDGDQTAGAGIRVAFGNFVADNTLQSNPEGIRLDNLRNAVVRNSFIHNTNHISDVLGGNTLPGAGNASTAINNDNIFH